MIGHLQSNKANVAAELFQVVQTVDRAKLAKALARRASELNKTLKVLLQVNVGQEPQKSGCSEEDAPALAEAVIQMPGLDLKGLMTMPPFFDDPGPGPPLFRPAARVGRTAQGQAAAGVHGRTFHGHERRLRGGHCRGSHPGAGGHRHFRGKGLASVKTHGRPKRPNS